MLPATGEGWRLLLFGASGAIGQAVAEGAIAAGWSVVGVTRGAAPANSHPGIDWISYDPVTGDGVAALTDWRPFDGVCWAQGANMQDSLLDFDEERHMDLYRANCLSVIKSAAILVEKALLRPAGARLCVVSSIWQERARQNKLSYIVTKAAIGGLVRSASVDLGAHGHLINGVLPGALDTPMTAANLTAAQIELVRSKTTIGRLPDLPTLANFILFLCSSANNSITGQSLTVDLGMSNASLF
jgi:NAD(P)-dependent dehydrogenase (short-subunit alcohol dehydrogenase family)